MPRKLYIVAYDIRQPKRLTAALRIVKEFASGGQKSAYECWLDEADRRELKTRLSEVLDSDQDSLALIPLSMRLPMTGLGAAVLPDDPDYFHIG